MREVSKATNEKAHPRVSGENGLTLEEAQTMGGSSPRERGKLSKRLILAHLSRLIPA